MAINILTKIFGSRNDRLLKQYRSGVARINALVAQYEQLSDEALKANPEKVPQVHIRGDVNAPWRCVAGAIYNSQITGYPTVGFLSNPVDPNAP